MRWIGHAGLARDRIAGAPDAGALAAALEQPIEMLELDVAVTADGGLVLLHDLRLPDGRPVVAVDLAAARGAVPGLLTLDEGLDAVAGRVPVLLDVKGQTTAAPLARRLRDRVDAADLLVCTDDAAALLVLRHSAPRVARWRTVPPTGSDLPGEGRRRAVAVALRSRLAGRLPLLVREVVACGVTVDRLALTSSLCDAAHRLGLEIGAWTVNTPRAAAAAARKGVDWITSDQPARLRF